MKALPSGTKVTSFSVATNRTWTDADGQRKEEVNFHNIVVFGRQAETVSQYLKKGSGAMIEGRIQTRSWDGPDGQKKYRTEIVADRIQFGPRTGGGGAPSNAPAGAPAQSQAAPANTTPKADEIETIQYPDAEKEPDIPF